jgi:hypothetical protein
MSYRDHTSRKAAAGAVLETIKATGAARQDEEEKPAASLPDFIKFSDLLANPPKEPPLLIAGPDPEKPKEGALMHRGDKVVLGAESKAGKTWYLLQKCLCIAAGIPFLGHQTAGQSGIVLYVNFELKPWAMAKRVKWVAENLGIVDKVGRGKAPDNFMVWNLRGVKGGYDIENVINVALERLRGLEVAVVAIDPLYKSYAGKDENSAGDMAKVLETMEGLSEALEASLLISSHFAKGDSAGKAQIDRISGSGVIARDPDAIATLSKLKDGPEKCYVWELTLRNMACPKPRVVEFKSPIWVLRDDLSAGGKAYDLQELANLLPLEGGMSSNEWFDAAAGEGICGDRNRFTKLKDQCLQKGLVAVEKGPRNAQIFRCKKAGNL